jgi:hypothetical protein
VYVYHVLISLMKSVVDLWMTWAFNMCGNGVARRSMASAALSRLSQTVQKSKAKTKGDVLPDDVLKATKVGGTHMLIWDACRRSGEGSESEGRRIFLSSRWFLLIRLPTSVRS